MFHHSSPFYKFKFKSFLKTENIVNLLFKYLIYILLAVGCFSFFSILLTSTSIKLFSFDITEKGWRKFVDIFTFPLSVFGISIPIYGILVALKRLIQSDELIKLNRETLYYTDQALSLHVEAFKADYRPFIMNKQIEPNIEDDIFYLKLTITNFGKLPAKIFKINIIIKEQNNEIFSNIYNDLHIILPGKDEELKKIITIVYNNELHYWTKNQISTEIYIDISYIGLQNTEYIDKEIWRLNFKDSQFKFLESYWK